MPSVPFDFVTEKQEEEEKTSTAAPVVTEAKISSSWRTVFIRFSTEVTVNGTSYPGRKRDICNQIFTDESLKVIDGGSGDAECSLFNNKGSSR